MSRKLCCICLALSVFISTVSIAYADSTSITHPTAEDYRQAVAYLETAGLQTGFDSARTSTQRLYSADLPAGGQDASVTQLQFMALDEMEAELQAQQAAREQVADNLALLAQYDGVMLNSDTTVYSDAGVTASDNVIEGDKVAKLKDIDESGSWYYVSFSDFSGYVSADACTPVDYAEYEDTEPGRTQGEIDALAKTSYAATFGSGVVSGSPADKAGLKVGDVIVAYDGNAVSSTYSLLGYVRASALNDKVTLTIVRGGKTMDVEVTLDKEESAVNGSGSSNSNNNQNNRNNQNGNGQNGNGNGNSNNGNDSNGYGNNDYGNGGFSDPFGLW